MADIVLTPLLRVEGLCKRFVRERPWWLAAVDRLAGRRAPIVTALDDVSFAIGTNEVVGLLGESGSGKSTLARVLMGLMPHDAGQAWLEGEPLLGAGPRRSALARKLQIIFQDPVASLNPRLSVRSLLSEPLSIHGHVPAAEWERAMQAALTEVGLEANALDRYPGEFSGGQRQRLGICRALLLGPKLLIADEAVSALDVSVQAQIVSLLLQLKAGRGMSLLFIAHDVALVRQVSDRILVLYRGRLVEEMRAECLLSDAAHPYTRRLLGSALTLREGREAQGGAPAVAAKSDGGEAAGGCWYRAECGEAGPECSASSGLRELHSGHRVACVRGSQLFGDRP